MKDIKILPTPKVNLLLKLDNSLELLVKTSEELLQELEREQEKSAHVKLTLRTKPRWFYQDYKEPQVSYTQSEIKKVEEQIRYELDGVDLDIARDIVANLDHRGFFVGNVRDIAGHYHVEEEYVEEIRDFIRKEIEPLGVASKNLEEFILSQLEELYPKEKELHAEVLRVLRGQGRDNRAKEVLSRLKLTPFEGEGVVYKGGSVDVVFEFDGSEWYLFLMDDFWDVEAVGAGKPLAFILELRRRLLRAVGELILERQAGFMLGKAPLKSLTLSEVASRSGVSLSTVSRVVSRKYASTPVGIYPLRMFFLRESKKGLSREEILKALKELLEGEGKGKSDAELSRMLSQRGISMARRTVNKYRRMIEGEK
ncbi:MAG: LacI family DNA-binding transcriptional regulator [Aquificaceae bacterium]|nr:LacI family DNA-binding transcriptional regulator [Aquificaceae bacterium]